MKFFYIFSIFILINFTTVNNFAQEKDKKTNIKFIKIDKTKLKVLKQNANYRIINKKNIKINESKKTNRKKQSVIDALKKEFHKN